jgi:hypothetical protein
MNAATINVPVFIHQVSNTKTEVTRTIHTPVLSVQTLRNCLLLLPSRAAETLETTVGHCNNFRLKPATGKDFRTP